MEGKTDMLTSDILPKDVTVALNVKTFLLSIRTDMAHVKVTKRKFRNKFLQMRYRQAFASSIPVEDKALSPNPLPILEKHSTLTAVQQTSLIRARFHHHFQPYTICPACSLPTCNTNLHEIWECTENTLPRKPHILGPPLNLGSFLIGQIPGNAHPQALNHALDLLA